MATENHEIRSFGGDAAPQLVQERTIEGRAIVYGQESKVMIDLQKRRFFIEVIEPGAISDETIRGCDVKALSEHNRERMLARSFKGSGSLVLSVDNQGLKYRFEAPNTQEGEYVVEMVKRGDLFGSSFAYRTDEKKNVSYEKRADGILLRKVHKIDRIFDISVVSDPAYMGTEVNVRSLDNYFEPDMSDESYKQDVNVLRNLINR